jgi:hypothetical protein
MVPIRLDLTRRQLFGSAGFSLGSAALSTLLKTTRVDADETGAGAALPKTHRPARCKHVIFLHMVGGPSQMDLFDYKPLTADKFDKDMPASVLKGVPKTGSTASLKRYPIAPSAYKFARHGQSGMWVSELLPHTARMVDGLTIVRSMFTESVNHEPAITFMQSGNQIPGRPCMGSWIAYGLGSLEQNLPTFVVMIPTPSHVGPATAISSRLWSHGYLPGENVAVSLRSSGDAIPFLSNPPGISEQTRRTELDGLGQMNRLAHAKTGDPETLTRISQYEMAFRMQTSVPELSDLSKESEKTLELYGPDAKKPGSFANTALTARRLVERGVRFVQIYHNGWDHHAGLLSGMPNQCRDIDQPCAALIRDLKARGLLDSTLVIWGGEFGRTMYCQGALSKTNYGRDHHGRCFTMWMAGGGAKPGAIHGETDDFSYNVAKDPVHVRDFHATVLHLLGIDHERLTYHYLGLDQRLTGVEKAEVVKAIIA